MAYWLFKSEPEAFSFTDLLAEPDRTTGWDGVRNYQARNLLRDTIKVGDGVLFYHSSTILPASRASPGSFVRAIPTPRRSIRNRTTTTPRAIPPIRPGSRSRSRP